MTLQRQLDQITRNDWDTLRGGAERGDYPLPDALTKPYDALQRLAAAAPPTVAPDASLTVQEAAQQLMKAALSGKPVPVGVGQLSATRASAQDRADWAIARDLAADGLMGQLVSAVGGHGGELIVSHLQPVFGDKVQTFTADLATLGAHAGKDQPDIALVAETDEVRQAYIRHYNTHTWYASLRTAWRILRRNDPGVLHDPNGVDSLLAEIANASEVAPDHWGRPFRVERGEIGGPWPSNATPARLAWIVTSGGRLWLPTAAEQEIAWAPFAPDPTPYHLRGGVTDPMAILRRRAGLAA